MKRYNKGDKVVSKRYFDIDINGYLTQICKGDIGTVDWDSGDEIDVYFGDYVRLSVGREDIEPYNSEPEDKVTIEGWVARDGNNSLYLYEKRPVRDHNEWTEEIIIHLDDDLFPNLTWSDDPLEITITIKQKKI